MKMVHFEKSILLLLEDVRTSKQRLMYHGDKRILVKLGFGTLSLLVATMKGNVRKPNKKSRNRKYI